MAVCDYVEPSPMGTRWGLGGTCVNVGCIPKKLMHHAGVLGQQLRDAQAYGWSNPAQADLNWSKLVENVQNHILNMNFSYRSALMDESIKYYNARARFDNASTVVAVDKKGKEHIIKAKNIVLAVGGVLFTLTYLVQKSIV